MKLQDEEQFESRCSGTHTESWCVQTNLGEVSEGCANAVRWERKENWRWSLAEVHLPDVCKLGVPPSAPEKKEKLKQEINCQ